MNGHDLGKLEGLFEAQKEYLEFRFNRLEGKNEEQDKRIKKLENGKWWNRAGSTGGGILGGFLAIITLGLFKN